MASRVGSELCGIALVFANQASPFIQPDVPLSSGRKTNGQGDGIGTGSPCAAFHGVARWYVSIKQDEGSDLLTLAESYPTLKEMRVANPPMAKAFLAATKNQSENWPTEALIDGYLDALP